MVETFTPAGCGGRARRIAGLACFTAGAVAAAAALGGLLGLAGSALPGRWALAATAALCALGGLRELGALRIPLPMMRRQVPEAWRRKLALPVWTVGYGVILATGFGTYQPVGTFWIVCAGAVAIGSPGAAAVALVAFGAGRAMMVALPGDPLGRLAAGHRLLRPVNAAVLLALAALLAPSAATAAPPAGATDPSASGGALAFTLWRDGTSSVVVVEPGHPAVFFPGARLPALSGDALAYVDDDGIRLVFWRTGQEVLRVPGRVDRPALSGPRLAYVETVGPRRRLVVFNFTRRTKRVIASVGPGVDLGRPALAGQLLAWHEAAGDSNRILLRVLASGVTRVVTRGGRSGLVVNPALSAGHIAWVESRGERSTLYIRRLPSGRVRRVTGALGPTRHLWSTAMDARLVYVTRWNLLANTASILRYRWR